MSTGYIEEGLEILKILDKYFPKHFKGKDSIQWLHNHTTQKKQDEWAAFFFEEYCFPLLTRFLGGWKGPRITNNKRFDYQRDFVWDLKVESNFNKDGRPSNWIILNDIKSTKRVIELEAGIGYIIATADFKYDIDGTLRKWRDNLEGRTRPRSNSRVLKKSGSITNIIGIFIKNIKQIDEALDAGWIRIFNQGKNSDGSPREPKYQIRLDKIPDKLVIRL